MKTISISEYEEKMGQLISLSNIEDYVEIKGSIHMDIRKLLDNPWKYLDKDKTYYFYCENGSRSRRAVRILSSYGFNVVKVTTNE